MGPRVILVVGLSLLLVYVPVVPAASPAVVGRINTKGAAAVNGARVPAEATVFAGDRITTEKQTATGLSLPGGDQVFLPSLSAARVNRADGQVTVALEHGALAVISRSSQPVIIQANGVRIQAINPDGGVYEVAVHSAALKVMTRKGTTLVKAADRSMTVEEGKTIEATAAPGPVGPGGLSPLWTAVLVTSAAAGFTGLGLGVASFNRNAPQDCVVVSVSTISCP